MRTALWIALKDLRIRTRDVSAFLVLLAMPVALILLLSAALGGLGGEPDFTIKVAIVNLDEGGGTARDASSPPQPIDLGAVFEESFTGTDGITDLFDIEVAEDEAAVRRRVAEGELTGALIIPKDFTRSVNAARPVDIEVIRDPGSAQSAGAWESVVRAVANRFAAATVVVRATIAAVGEASGEGRQPDPAAIERATQLALSAVQRPGALERVAIEESAAETGPEITALDFYGMSMTAMFLLFGAMYGAFGILEEKRQKTLARLHSAPIAHGTVTAGKMIGIFIIGFAQFTVLYVVTRFMLGVYWGESVAATFAVAAGELVATAGMGAFIAAVSKNERAAGGIGPLLVQVEALIGGTFFSFAALPAVFQYLQYLSVPGWALTAWQDIQLRGAGLADVWLSVLVLVGWGALFWALGTWRQKAVAT